MKQNTNFDHQEEFHSGENVPSPAMFGGTAASAFRVSGKETILLVEDEGFIREALRETLESAGYNVLISASATEAKETYWKHPDSVNLLLADFVLPGMTGGDLADELAHACPTMRILLMSGYARLRAMDASAPNDQANSNEWIAKPFSTMTLLRRIRETLDGYSSADETAAQARLA